MCVRVRPSRCTHLASDQYIAACCANSSSVGWGGCCSPSWISSTTAISAPTARSVDYTVSTGDQYGPKTAATSLPAQMYGRRFFTAFSQSTSALVNPRSANNTPEFRFLITANSVLISEQQAATLGGERGPLHVPPVLLEMQ